MPINEIRDFTFENYYKRIRFSKENSYLLLLTNKLIETIPDPYDAKEHYQSFIRKKYKKVSKIVENNYLLTKIFCKPQPCCYKISYYRISKIFT